MKIGLLAPTVSPFADAEYLTVLGRAAEERGFESLWVPEHVVLFDDYSSRYPYAADGRVPVSGENGCLEPWTTLAFIASATTTIRLGTGICLVPQRNPVYLAKEIANVDYLSGGRVDLGVGIGWLAEEFRAVGVPWERRGARTDAYLDVIKTCWCDDVSEHKSEFYELPACRLYPKPAQDPHPPIHIGGESPAAMRRAARRGTGWFGFDRDPEAARAGIADLEQALADEGRPRSEVEVTIGPYMRQIDRDDVKRYADAGVDRLVVPAAAPNAAGLPAVLDELAGRLY